MTMQRYSVFGGTLRSELQFDELQTTVHADPDWTLRVIDGAAPPEGELLGIDTVFGETKVRGFRRKDGLGLVFDDTGRFDISVDGSVITWHRPPTADLGAVRADVTSRVLALALHAGGVLSLHASAVSVNGAGIAFMAPKLHGKSTLCSALVMTGGLALSDDTVPVRPGSPPHLSPGLPRLRLWSDAASRVFGRASPEQGPRTKLVMDNLEQHQLEQRTVPFRAAYVLNPVTHVNDGSLVKRERMDAVSSAIALVMHSKLGPVLTGTESPVVLTRAADIARQVPVYVLHVVRDLDRIDEVARTISSWHAADGDVNRNA